jgi:uncharacterized protein (DUF2141 family)
MKLGLQICFLAVCGSAVPQSPALSPPSDNCTFVVHATGFRNQKGDAGGSVFASANGWPEDNSKALTHHGFPIEGDHATMTFHVPPGRYAVAVLHDENSNHKLDRNFLHIPKEGFGFANNPHVGLSPPKWDDAAVTVACPVTEINVRLIYK